METKFLKVKTRGSIATADYQPIIADFLPKGITLNALQYDYTAQTVIVKLSWSLHPYVETPDQLTLNKLFYHESVIEVLPDSTTSQFKTQIRMKQKYVSQIYDDEGKPSKQLLHNKTGVKANYIKVIQGKYKLEYLLDEG